MIATSPSTAHMIPYFTADCQGGILIFFRDRKSRAKPLFYWGKSTLRTMRGDRRRKNFSAATTQLHTNRTTPQVPHLWRHLGRRRANGRDQSAVERPTIAPTASTFGPVSAGSGRRAAGRTGRATDRADGDETSDEIDERATCSTDRQADGQDGQDGARTDADAITTPRVDIRSCRIIPLRQIVGRLFHVEHNRGYVNYKRIASHL